MTIEELSIKINELELRFEGLKDAMSIFQDNISNNIYWFYSVLGIFVALLGAVGVALYFLVKTSVSKGIEVGINNIDSNVRKEISKFHEDIQKLESQFDDRTINLFEKNPQIKWAKGTIDYRYSLQNGLFTINNLIGPINWQSPILDIKVKAFKNQKDVLFNVVTKTPDGFSAELLNFDELIDGNMIEWSIVWTNIKES